MYKDQNKPTTPLLKYVIRYRDLREWSHLSYTT